MVAADELGIASPQCVAVGIGSKTEHAQRLAVGFTERPSILAVGLDRPEPGADGVERIDEIGPSGRRRAVGGKGAGLSFPSAIGRLRLLYLLRAPPLEILVADLEQLGRASGRASVCPYVE